MPRFSIVVAVFNRPDEMQELLESLTEQSFTDFDVVVVEDGSSIPCSHICDLYRKKLTITYLLKENGGPGPARNHGCLHSSGEVLIFLDSDCTVPPDWLKNINAGMESAKLDAFGGPDREHPLFSSLQKAISYSMTSVLTTGGIRGKTVRTGGAFHPRSFNMGISREVFQATHGFAPMRFGEDIDLSIRIIRAGFRVGLIPEAWVYHKRRATFKTFYKQVFNSGMARISLTQIHPGTLKITHMFPTAFALYSGIALLCFIISPALWPILIPILAYLASILVHSSVLNKNLHVGILSVATSLIQLLGYGAGFVVAFIRKILLGQKEAEAFKKTYYK